MLRHLRGPIGVAMVAASIVVACGGGATTASPSPTTAATATPKPTVRIGGLDRPIVLAITPSAEVARLTTTGNAIASALGQATGLRWKVQVPTSYAAEIEAMCSGQADVAFIAPLQMTLLLDKGCGTPFMAAVRAAYVGGPLSTTYNSQILVRTDSGINTLADLKGKKFAYTDAISTSGYLFPLLMVKQKLSADPKTFFAQTIFAGGHPQAVLAVYNKQVDAAASFEDARVKVPGGTDLAAGMPADILQVTKVIEKAGPIPNDGIAVSNKLPADVQAAIKKALLDYASSDAGKKQFKDLYAWDGIQEVKADFYDAVRDAAKLAGIDVAAEAAKTPRPPASPSPSKSP